MICAHQNSSSAKEVSCRDKFYIFGVKIPYAKRFTKKNLDI